MRDHRGNVGQDTVGEVIDVDHLRIVEGLEDVLSERLGLSSSFDRNSAYDNECAAPLSATDILGQLHGALGEIATNLNHLSEAAHTVGLGLDQKIVLNGLAKDIRAALPVLLEAISQH